MNDQKKALTSAVLCGVCALIWIIACLMHFEKLAGTSVLIMMICAAIASVISAIVWFIRYVKLNKSNK